MACGHLFARINDISVCLKCGLTICKDNTKRSVVFDHKLINRKGMNQKNDKWK